MIPLSFLSGARLLQAHRVKTARPRPWTTSTPRFSHAVFQPDRAPRFLSAVSRGRPGGQNGVPGAGERGSFRKLKSAGRKPAARPWERRSEFSPDHVSFACPSSSGLSNPRQSVRSLLSPPENPTWWSRPHPLSPPRGAPMGTGYSRTNRRAVRAGFVLFCFVSKAPRWSLGSPRSWTVTRAVQSVFFLVLSSSL